MDNLTNCPNCAAPVDLTVDNCPYCDTPYPRPHRPVVLIEPQSFHIDTAMLAGAVAEGIITVNEARRLLGMTEI